MATVTSSCFVNFLWSLHFDAIGTVIGFDVADYGGQTGPFLVNNGDGTFTLYVPYSASVNQTISANATTGTISNVCTEGNISPL